MGVYFRIKGLDQKKRWNRLLEYNDYVPKCSIKRNAISWLAIVLVGIITVYATGPPSRGSESIYKKNMAKNNGLYSSGRHLLFSSPDGDGSEFSADNMTIIYTTTCETQNISVFSLVSHGPVWERCDYERSTNMVATWIMFYSFLTIVIFVAVAIVCDDFFVPSLEAISEKLKLSEDVAGATFMAAGSSAPELFSSIAAVTFESDVGVGTITGSAVFNLLVIVALTAAFAGQELHLDWRPLTRDAIFYAISISWFIYSVWDTIIQLWEPIVMLALYFVYILVMIFNKSLMDFLARIEYAWFGIPQDYEDCNVTPEPSHNLTDKDNAPLEAVIVGGNNQNGVGSDDRRTSDADMYGRRMSQMSRSSSEMKMFKHHRRNSVIHSIAAINTSRGSVKFGDEVAFNLKRNSVRQSVSNNMRPLREENRQLEEEEPPDEENEALKDHPHGNRWSRDNHDTLEEMRPFRDQDRVEELDEFEDDGQLDDIPVNNIDEEDFDDDDEEEEEEVEPRMSCCPWIRGAPPSTEALKKGKSTEGSCLGPFCIFIVKWIIFIIAFPFLLLFSITIPDCSKDHNRKWFLVSFFTSVFWIAALSFGMVTVVARIGCLIRVDSFVMSLVVLAAGTSIPDLLSSIIVARDGFGDMAVSNAIGSNVFDINLGLGFPFLIRILIGLGKPLDFFSQKERRAYCTDHMVLMPHPKFGIILLILLGLALGVLGAARFHLGKTIGFTFFLSYLVFLLYAFIQEFVCSANGVNYVC